MSRRKASKQPVGVPGGANVEAPKPTTSDVILPRVATADPPLVQQFNRIGGNLTPQTISAILSMADIGRISRFVDLMHEMRQKDGHLQCCLQAAEYSIGSLPWDIDPPPNANRKERKIAALAKDSLAANGQFRTLIEHFAGEGPLFGHAHSEVIWDVIDGAMIPVKFKNLSCRRFGFRMADGTLAFDPRGVLEADVNIAGVDLLKEYPLGKFLSYRPRINGDVPAREGLARILVWLALGRNWTYKDWLEFADLFWKPKRFGKYQKGAGKEDKQAIIDMLEQVMNGGVGIFPETTEPVFQWPQLGTGGKNSPHKELNVWIAGEISKTTLGSTDIVEPSENGAKAAVETRSELKTEIRNARAVGIATEAIQPLIEAITRLNGGDGVRAGTFKFITVEPPDLSKFATAVKDLAAAKVRVVESWVHDQAGMPAPKPDDILVGDQVDDDGNRVKPSEREDQDDELGKEPEPKQDD
jgi:phage gp29-like protein